MKAVVAPAQVDEKMQERADRIARSSEFADARFSRFAQFVESLPPASDEFTNMSDEQMKNLLGERHV